MTLNLSVDSSPYIERDLRSLRPFADRCGWSNERTRPWSVVAVATKPRKGGCGPRLAQMSGWSGHTGSRGAGSHCGAGTRRCAGSAVVQIPAGARVPLLCRYPPVRGFRCCADTRRCAGSHCGRGTRRCTGSAGGGAGAPGVSSGSGAGSRFETRLGAGTPTTPAHHPAGKPRPRVSPTHG
jgi:hypothetical protein